VTGLLVVASLLAAAGAVVVLAGDLGLHGEHRSRSVAQALLAPTALGLLIWWVWAAQ